MNLTSPETAAPPTPTTKATKTPLLIIYPGFPGLGGDSRLKIIRELPGQGIAPTVVARKLDRPKNTLPGLDGIEIAETTCIQRTPFRIVGKITGKRAHGLWLESLFFVPDLMVLWMPFAVWKARQIVRSTGARTVFSTSPPESVHLVARALKRQLGLRWIADFRDLWTTKTVVYNPPTRLHDRWVRKMEKNIYAEADAVIANTPGNQEYYIRDFAIPAHKIHLIPGCYGSADESSPMSLSSRKPGPLRIGYMGRFDKNGFPWLLWFNCLKAASIQSGVKIEFHLCGVIAKETLAEVSKMGLEGQVIYHGQMLHSEAMDHMRACDVLLLTMYETPYSHAIVPHKLYYYLALRRPVLAIAEPNGGAAQIIQQAQAGVTLSGNNPQGIQQALQTWSAELQKNQVLHYNGIDSEIVKYSSKNHAARLAALVNSYT